MTMEEYRKAYMDGYLAGKEDAKREIATTSEQAVVTAEDIMKRYGVGRNKALEVIRAVRRTNNGGALGTRGRVLMGELLCWESRRDNTFVRDLKATIAK